MTVMPPLRAQLSAGVAAGIVGAIAVDAFLFALQIAGGRAPAAVVAGTWTFVAVVVLGAAAMGNPAAPLIGALLHLCVSIGWALGYVYLMRTLPQLATRPWISGAAFGLVVFVFMQIVLITAGQYHRPTPGALVASLVAHTAFFGVPVALVASRMLRRPIAG